jgi:hypothetical protein
MDKQKPRQLAKATQERALQYLAVAAATLSTHCFLAGGKIVSSVSNCVAAFCFF